MSYINEKTDADGFHTFEMIKVIACEDYRSIREATVINAKAEKFSYYDYTKNTFISEEFKMQGVILAFVHPDSKPVIFKMRINPRRLLGDNTYVGILEFSNQNREAIVEKINEILSHIGAHWDFEAMSFSRLDLCANRVFENPYETESYMRLIRKSFVPAGYKKQRFLSNEYNYQEKNKKSFRISNGIRTITVYDKRFQLEAENLTENDYIDSIGLLRFEVALYAAEINKFAGSMSNKDKLGYFSANGMKIMRNIFNRIFYPMPYYRYCIAIDMIRDAAVKRSITYVMSKKMIELTQAISSYKNVNEALISLNYTNQKKYSNRIRYKEVAKIMEEFIKLGLNPITMKNKDPGVSLHSVIQLLDRETGGEDN